MADKKLVNLYLDINIIDHFTDKARRELKDEGEPVNKITLQRRRAFLMTDLLTEFYEAEIEE